MPIRALVLAGLLGGSAPAVAQPTPPPFAETIQVTASLREEETAEVAASVAVVTAAEAEARQATSVHELLASLPGLALVQSGSPGKAVSLFARGTNSNQTLVLVDGVRQNEPFLGGFDWAFAMPEEVERIESVRGPFSVLYGSAAVGGVVQLVTRRAPGASLRLEGGGRGYRRAGLTAGFDRGPLSGSLSGAWQEGEGEVANDFFDGGAGRLRLDWRPAGGLSVGLSGRWQEAEIGLPVDYFGQPAPERRQQSRTRHLAIPLAWQGARLSLDGSAARVEQEVALADPLDPFAASRSEARSDQLRGTARRLLGERWELAAGGEWERQRATSADAFGGGLADERERREGLFAQTTWRGERTRFEAGVRRDEHDSFGGATSWRGGGVVRLSERLRLRASYGEAFRAPSLGDLYFPGFGNPELAPERSRGMELGAEGEAGPWRWSAVAFENRLRDLVQFDFATFRPFNTGRARTRGLELAAHATFGTGWLRAAATWLEAEDRATGERLLRRPREAASLAGGVARGRWAWHGGLRHVGDRIDVGGVELAAFTVAEVGTSWRGGAHWQPYLRVENLLDRAYEEAAGFPAPGRTWVAGVALRAGR